MPFMIIPSTQPVFLSKFSSRNDNIQRYEGVFGTNTFLKYFQLALYTLRHRSTTEVIYLLQFKYLQNEIVSNKMKSIFLLSIVSVWSVFNYFGRKNCNRNFFTNCCSDDWKVQLFRFRSFSAYLYITLDLEYEWMIKSFLEFHILQLHCKMHCVRISLNECNHYQRSHILSWFDYQLWLIVCVRSLWASPVLDINAYLRVWGEVIAPPFLISVHICKWKK